MGHCVFASQSYFADQHCHAAHWNALQLFFKVPCCPFLDPGIYELALQQLNCHLCRGRSCMGLLLGEKQGIVAAIKQVSTCTASTLGPYYIMADIQAGYGLVQKTPHIKSLSADFQVAFEFPTYVIAFPTDICVTRVHVYICSPQGESKAA